MSKEPERLARINFVGPRGHQWCMTPVDMNAPESDLRYQIYKSIADNGGPELRDAFFDEVGPGETLCYIWVPCKGTAPSKRTAGTIRVTMLSPLTTSDTGEAAATEPGVPADE